MPAELCRARSAGWEATLDALEIHVEEIRAALEGRAAAPEPYSVRLPDEQLPKRLLPRARLVLEAQRDLEIVLRERVGILGRAIERDPQRPWTQVSFYIDRTA